MDLANMRSLGVRSSESGLYALVLRRREATTPRSSHVTMRMAFKAFLITSAGASRL
jgi:hypothetical protein